MTKRLTRKGRQNRLTQACSIYQHRSTTMQKLLLALWTAWLLASSISVCEARPRAFTRYARPPAPSLRAPITANSRRQQRRAHRHAAILFYPEQRQVPRRSQLPREDEREVRRHQTLLTAKPGTPSRSIAAAETTKTEASTQMEPVEEPRSRGSQEFDHLPFAIPAPGKPGYVTLPGKHSNLPQIDVRGLASGTPVEIPDPDTPRGKIQFRVP